MKLRKVVNICCIAGMALWLAGCAAVGSTSSPLVLNPQKIDNLVIWSEVGSMEYNPPALFVPKPSRPFPDTFHDSVVAALSAQGVAVTYQEVRDPGRMSKKELAQLRAQDGPNATTRLLINVKKVRMRSYPRAKVEGVAYHLTLFSVVTNKPLWQADISVDCDFEPIWSESTATKFANEIVALLKKDGLV